MIHEGLNLFRYTGRKMQGSEVRLDQFNPQTQEFSLRGRGRDDDDDTDDRDTDDRDSDSDSD